MINNTKTNTYFSFRSPVFILINIVLFLISWLFLPDIVHKQSLLIWFATLTILVFVLSKGSILYCNIFVLNCLFAMFLYNNALASNGTEFYTGGDDERFYEFAQYYKTHMSELFYSNLRYKGYLFILIFGLKAIDLIATGSEVLCLMFFKALISMPTYSYYIKYLQLQTKEKNTHNAALLIFILNPLILYYNTVLLRDSTIVTCFLVILFLLTKINQQTIKTYDFVLLILVFFYLFHVRISSLFFVFSYALFVRSRNGNQVTIEKWIVSGLIFLILISTAVFNDSLSAVDVFETGEKYSLLRQNNYLHTNSYATSLLNSKQLFMIPFQMGYVASGGAPEVLKGINKFTLVISLGQITLFCSVFLIVLNTIQAKFKTNKEVLYLMFVSYLVAKTSGDPRHLAFTIPLVLTNAVYIFFMNVKTSLLSILSMILFMNGLVIFYLKMKNLI